MIKVSVVVPIYNVKAYIDECIMSLVNQSLQEIDIILVDDGSSDGSQNICDNFAARYENVRVIHKENNGLGSARNVGLEVAIGKYVYFIDGDDSLKKDALEKLYRHAERETLDVILFSAECFSDGLGIEYNANEYRRTKCLNEVISGKELFIRLMEANEYYASIPLRFYRTEYLKEKEYCFPEDIIHEDEIYAYWSLIQAKKALCISDRFYNRRFRAGSIMTSKKAYNSCIGYLYTWKQIMMSLNDLTDWNYSEIQNTIRFANSRLGIVANLYAFSLDKRERRQIKKYLAEIKDIVKNNELIILNKQLYLFLFVPLMFCVLFKILNFKNILYKKMIDTIEKISLSLAIIKLQFAHVCDKSCVILIGTPTHGNLGDQAIVLSEKKMISQTKYKHSIVEICSKNYLKYSNRIQKAVSPNDVIIIDGGGSMGTLWVNNEYRFRDIILRFSNNNIYIFPQTIYYGSEGWEEKVLKESELAYSSHPNLTIFCRDIDSFKFAKVHFSNNRIIHTPDMVLSLYPQKFRLQRKDKVLICFRDDLENTNNEMKKRLLNIIRKTRLKVEATSTLTGGYINTFSRKKEVNRKLKEFASVKLVVTDRLHALIFCALTGTPCIAIDNLSKKVSGTYDWVNDLSYLTLVKNENDIKDLNVEDIMSKADEFENLNHLCNKYEELKGIVCNDRKKCW